METMVIEDDIPVPKPGPGEILVKIRAVGLSYIDLLVALGQFPTPEFENGLVPVSDGAGDVVELGEGVTSLKVGDRVHSLYLPNWITGPPTPENLFPVTGLSAQGCLIQYRIFSATAVLSIPSHLSYEEASTIPCVGVTAYAALFENPSPVGPGSDVLVLGTGGISIWALQLAKVAGARVLATSSSDAKIERVKELGADETVNYARTPEWEAEVKKLTDGRGVDHVVEIGGSGTLVQAIKATRLGGHVHLIGFVTGDKGNTNVGNVNMAAIRGMVHLHGIFVGSREMAIRLNKIITQHKIKPVVDKVFKFEDAKAAFEYQLAQKHFGKVVITVD